MPSDLFLEAVHRREALKKGYPLAGKGVVNDRELAEMGITGDPMYRITNPILHAVQRLQASSAASDADTARKRKTQGDQDAGALRARQEAERRGAD